MRFIFDFLKGAVLIIALVSFLQTIIIFSEGGGIEALQTGFMSIWSLVLYISFKVNVENKRG